MRNLRFLLLVMCSLCLTCALIMPAQSASLRRISVSQAGEQGNSVSWDPKISANGRYVAFSSWASNLVAGDTNGQADVFVKDLSDGRVIRASVSSSGVQGNGTSFLSAISPSGRYVSYYSWAGNLVPGDTNHCADVFVYDLQTGRTRRASTAADGTQGNDTSYVSALSETGRYVVFESLASNLVPGDTPASYIGLDIFRKDMTTGAIERVSVATDGTPADALAFSPAVSYDGRYIAFHSWSTKLTPDDANDRNDIFLRDMQARTTVRITNGFDGSTADHGSFEVSMDAQAQFLCFQSKASNLVDSDTNGRGDAFLYNRLTDTMKIVGRRYDGTRVKKGGITPVMSGDGRYVAFRSADGKIVRGDTNDAFDIFLYDRRTASYERVSVADDGTQGIDREGREGGFAVSHNGRFCAFDSPARTLVPGDTNQSFDVFLWDRNGVPATPAAASSLALSATAAVNSGRATQVVVQLSQAATVETVVTNIAGQTVATLGPRDLPRGSSQWLWQAKSDRGTALPGGQYLLTLTARAADGTQARALAPLSLAR